MASAFSSFAADPDDEPLGAKGGTGGKRGEGGEDEGVKEEGGCEWGEWSALDDGGSGGAWGGW